MPVNRVDALSVMMHEMGHILAYNGWSSPVTGVPHPDYWSTFERWFQPGAPTIFLGPFSVAAWGTPPDLTTDNNRHWGNPANLLPAEYGVWTAGSPPILWRNGVALPRLGCGLTIDANAPSSNDLHRHPNEEGASLIDELMNGVVFRGGHRYDISPLDRGLMIDVGLFGGVIFANGFQ